MSRRTTASTSLKSLKKRCNEVDFKFGKQFLVWSSPQPTALLASAILCRSLKRSEKLFLFSVCSPLETIDRINDLKDKYNHYSLILVGVDLEGKKRIKKGSGYPLLVGGEFDSAKAAELAIGDNHTIIAAAYAFADINMNTLEYETSLAAIGALIQEESHETKVKASKDLIELAMNRKLIQERKGLRLAGADRLPLAQLLLHSTRPFLQGVSGNRKACDDILNEADIPTPKYAEPITALTTKEIQRLNSILISRVPAIIPYIETEYIVLQEDKNSPLRSVSDARAVLETSWSLREFGTTFAVLLGDRGASLRSLLDSQMKHQEETVSAVVGLQASLGNRTLPNDITLRVSDRVLTDVGRIIFELELVDTKVLQIALSNESSTEIFWRDKSIQIGQVIRRMGSTNTPITATSPRSLRFSRLPEAELADVMKKIAEKGEKD